VLVDANSYHFMQTEVYGYIAGTKDIDEIAVDLELWCGGFERPVRFIKDRIAALDAQKRVLILENGRLEYDYLIIATGARTRFPDSIKGLRERSFGIKQLGRSFGFHHKFEEVVKKRLEGERGRVNIAVIGAGLSGVEVAAEMGYMLKRYEKMLGSRADDIEITLVDACETILPGMDPYIIRTAAERLKKLGVSQRVSSSISSVKESEIVFENGDRMEYTFIIYTGGIVANSDFAPKEFRRNGIGQLLVTPYLNIEGYEQIYAVGDVAQIGDSAGRPLPPTAQIAEKSAEYAAESIKKRLSGVSAEPFRGRLDGIFIALGCRLQSKKREEGCIENQQSGGRNFICIFLFIINFILFAILCKKIGTISIIVKKEKKCLNQKSYIFPIESSPKRPALKICASIESSWIGRKRITKVSGATGQTRRSTGSSPIRRFSTSRKRHFTNGSQAAGSMSVISVSTAI